MLGIARPCLSYPVLLAVLNLNNSFEQAYHAVRHL